MKTTYAKRPRVSRLKLVKEKEFKPYEFIGSQVTLPLKKILEDPKNERKTYENIEELSKTVKSVGIIEPITATPDGKGKYIIVSGHRRFRAAKMAKLREINVVVCDPKESEAIRRRKSVISNLQREDINPIELAEGLAQLKEIDPEIKTSQDLARLLGKSKNWVSDIMRLLTLPENIKRNVRRAELPISKKNMTEIARLDDPVEQEKIVEALVEGAPRKEIMRQVKEVKDRKTAPPKRKPSAKITPQKRSFSEHSRKGKGWKFTCDVSIDANTGELVEALKEMTMFFEEGI